MYIKRHLENEVLKSSKVYPVVLVCGARQVGKSTMLNHIKETDRKFVTFDDMEVRSLAEENPKLFFKTYGYKLLIDEIQYAPSILSEMKRIVDERALNGEDNSGMFWLTGSQKFHMMQNVSESLAGRVAVLDMSSMSNSEIEGREGRCFSPKIDDLLEVMKSVKKKSVIDIYNNIFRGGMPKLFTADVDRHRFYADYINTYLQRDVTVLSQVGDLRRFYKFLITIAARTGQELKYDDLSNQVGVSAPTIKSWVSILERSGIITILEPYFSSLSKRLIKTPKVYFMDTGLCAYLCRWSNAETLSVGAMDGAILETYVVSEIIKSYYNTGKRPDLYYYRDIDKKEIDLLIEEDDNIYPIEIKKSEIPNHADKNFFVLNKLKKNIQPGIILCLCDELIPYNESAWCCPIGVI